MHRRRTHSTFLLFFILTNKRYYKCRLSGFIWNFLSMEMKNIHLRIKILFCFASWNEINYNAYTTLHIYGIIREKTDMTLEQDSNLRLSFVGIERWPLQQSEIRVGWSILLLYDFPFTFTFMPILALRCV